MFHICHFRLQLFHVNKLINGKGLHSNWQRLSTIYGGQFSKIQQNGHPCIVQSRKQEFCQRNQFCNRTYDNIHPLPIENKNSSSNISLPETPTNNAIEKNRQSLEGIEKSIGKHATLETRWLELGNKKQLQIRLQKGRSGQKFFVISLNKTTTGVFIRSTNILVPEDAYAFVRSLDELIRELATDQFKQKLQNSDFQSTTEIVNNGRRLSKLKTVELNGQHHKFKLEVLFFPNTDKLNSQMQICLGINAVHKIHAKEKTFTLPLQTLPWLRKQMAEMLTKYDGTDTIEKEAPAQIPKQFFMNMNTGNESHPLPASDGNSNSFSLANGHSSSSLPNEISFKPQQSYQFCSGNDSNDYLHNNGNQPDVKYLPLDPNKKTFVKIQFDIGKTGHKFIEIQVNRHGRYYGYLKILVPEEAYVFLRALDELIGEFAMENFEQKLNIQDPQSTIEISNDRRRTSQVLKLRTVELTGRHHKFLLELLLYINADHRGNKGIRKEICLALGAINKSTMKNHTIYLKLESLPWLREQMAEMLSKYDGTEQIEKEMPAKIPQKFIITDIFRAHDSPVPNGDYSWMNQEGMQQQFIDNKPFDQATEWKNSNRYEPFYFDKPPYIEIRLLDLNIYSKKQLILKLQEGKSGQKFLQIIILNYDGQYFYSRNILVPQDAYAYLCAMDQLIEELAAENFEQKLPSKNSQSIVEADDDTDTFKFRSILNLRNVEIDGLLHKFYLELLLFTNSDMTEKEEICLGLCSINKIYSNKRRMILPLHVLPWLRKQMAEMLAKYDGTEKIEKEAPAKIPKKFFSRKASFNPMTTKILSFNEIEEQKTNLKQPEVKNFNKNCTTEQLVQQMSEFEEDIQTFFDFDDDEMKKYRIGS